MGTGDDLSSAALAIALAALVISAMQAIQQYFSTAEGFRFCRPDVMGSWSKLRQWRFDVDLARYETRFVAPHFMLVQPERFFERQSDMVFSEKSFVQRQMYKLDRKQREQDAKIGRERDWIWPVGHSEIPCGTSEKASLATARVSWLALLHRIQSYQETLQKKYWDVPLEPACASDTEKARKSTLSLERWLEDLHEQSISRRSVGETSADDVIPGVDERHGDYSTSSTRLFLPAVKKMLISWDFVPADLKKPFATITLHDLLVLGYRMGLDWVDVRPLEDKLVAQDDVGHFLSATRILGLGLVVEFQHEAKHNPLDRTKASGKPEEHAHIMVPSCQADKLAFGVIPGDARLGFTDIAFASQSDFLNYAGDLDVNNHGRERDARKRTERMLHYGDGLWTGLEQVLPLVAPCLLIPGCKATRVRKPNDWVYRGVLETMEAYMVFERTMGRWQQDAAIPRSRKRIIGWIQKKWARLGRELAKPFIWQAFRDKTNPAQLSTKMFEVHGACTRSLERLIDKLVAKLNEVRGRLEPGGCHFTKLERPPMQYLLRAHMWRALRLREKAEAVPREKIEVPESCKRYAKAHIWCQMMMFMLDDVGDLAREVIKNMLSDGVALELDPAESNELAELVENMWLIWLFRALVFNRSCGYTARRRVGAAGKEYGVIPAEWLYSQLPIHII